MAPNRQPAPSQPVSSPFGEARQTFDEVRRAIVPVRRILEHAISDHPVKAVGISLALGVLLGWLIKR